MANFLSSFLLLFDADDDDSSLNSTLSNLLRYSLFSRFSRSSSLLHFSPVLCHIDFPYHTRKYPSKKSLSERNIQKWICIHVITLMICETESLSGYFFFSSKAQLRMQIPSQFFLILYRISSHKKAKNIHVLEQSSLSSLFSALLLYFNSTRLSVTTAEDTTQKKDNRQHSGEGLWGFQITQHTAFPYSHMSYDDERWCFLMLNFFLLVCSLISEKLLRQAQRRKITTRPNWNVNSTEKKSTAFPTMRRRKENCARLCWWERENASKNTIARKRGKIFGA